MLQYVNSGKLQKCLNYFFSYPPTPDGSEHSMPSGSPRKKKLAKRPGYMRPEAQRQIEFQSLGACKPFSPEEFKHGRQHCEDVENCCLCGQYKKNFEFLHCHSTPSSAVVPADGVLVLGATGSMLGSCKNLSCYKNPQSENTMIPIYPAEATSKDASTACCARQMGHSTKVSEPQKMHALDQAEVNNNCEYPDREVVSHSVGSHDSFSSRFSFIQLSLNSASGVSACSACQHSLHCFSRPSDNLKHENETTVNDKLQDCETVSLSDTDATFSYSTDSSDAASAGSSVTSGYESSFTVSDHNWDTLMKKYEPVLLDCQLGNRSTLKVCNHISSLIPPPGSQNSYVADKFRRKLEELEKEKKSLKFQLPSRHPSISNFLDRFVTQVQATLRWAVCTSQKLCSTLRRKVSDIETQLPALLEAKMLAVSGNNFGTAKDLTEEIRSLTSEKEGLEGLLNELQVLSARNIRKLERIKDDYNRLKQELEQGETAFVTSVKENAEKYMEMLEDKLHSCGSQLLQRVWEADLEACQLLIRGFQLKETSCCGLEEEDNQMDELEMAADGPSDSEKRKESHFSKGTEWGTVPCSKHSELKQEFFIFSTELDEKCEAISEKLVHLEDQLQTSVCRVDEGLAQSLQREIQVVKETLQTVLVQLQPAREAGEEKYSRGN
uniref:DISC1 scaffold protein n=1 Tax=Anas platyrhynchos TaxID=8839 RepID=A0A8B9R7G7_ANAPL